jgi:hypothetical protein
MRGEPWRPTRTACLYAPTRRTDALAADHRQPDTGVRGAGHCTTGRAQVMPLVADFGLEGFTNHYPAQLSGGMRQRTALRTIVQGGRCNCLMSRSAPWTHFDLTRCKRGLKPVGRLPAGPPFWSTTCARPSFCLIVFVLSRRSVRVI